MVVSWIHLEVSCHFLKTFLTRIFTQASHYLTLQALSRKKKAIIKKCRHISIVLAGNALGFLSNLLQVKWGCSKRPFAVFPAVFLQYSTVTALVRRYSCRASSPEITWSYIHSSAFKPLFTHLALICTFGKPMTNAKGNALSSSKFGQFDKLYETHSNRLFS